VGGSLGRRIHFCRMQPPPRQLCCTQVSCAVSCPKPCCTPIHMHRPLPFFPPPSSRLCRARWAP
jgi:hypothetical protein